MSLAAVVALLQAALLLLSAAQNTPGLPPSFRDQATQVAQHAITEAGSAIALQAKTASSSTNTKFTTPSGAILDANGNVISSPPNTPTTVSNPITVTVSTVKIIGNSVHIEWTTSIPTESKIFFTPIGGTIQITQSASGNSTHHIVDLTGLLPQRTYNYTIEAISGQLLQNLNNSFISGECPNPNCSSNTNSGYDYGGYGETY